MWKQIKDNLGRLFVKEGRIAQRPAFLDELNATLVTAPFGLSDPPEPGWRPYHGRRVTVYAPQDSLTAMQRAPLILRDADHILDELHRLLAPDSPDASAPINLTLLAPDSAEPIRALSSEPQDGDHLFLRLDEPLVAPLTRPCILRWFGPVAAAAPLIVEGLAGLVAARTRLGPSVEEAKREIQAQIEAGQPVSLLARFADQDDPLAAPFQYDPLATSFVAYLVANFSGTALRTYLQTYDPARQDTAAMSAYQRPLGVLEESWHHSLHRRTGNVSAFRALLPRLLPLLKPYRRQQAEIVVYLLIAAACNVATPLVVKYFLKDFQDFFRHIHHIRADALFYFRHTLLRFVGILACIYALSTLVSLRRNDAVNRLNQNVLNSLQLKMFAYLQRLPCSFYVRAKTGDLMTRLTGDIDTIQPALSQLTNKSLYQIFMLVGGAIGLLLTTGFSVVTLLILLIVPLFAVSYAALRTQNKVASQEQRKRAGQTATMAQEILSAQAVIKAFGMEERVIASFRSRIQAQMRSKLRLARLSALTDMSEDVATALAQLVILGIGGYLVLVHPHTGIRIEDLVASLLLVKYIIGPVASLSGIGQTIHQASGAMDRINELLDEPITVADKSDALDLPPLAQAIRLDNVTFGYGEKQTILHNVSLTIPAGANVAIVGPTGSGKSTIINLLLRFWDPQEGRVLFDDHDLCDVKLASLRDQVGVVFQDTFLFDTTVRENIAVGRPQATDAEIIAAAQAARLDDDIQAMPAGYDTVLGERGVRMSGGQRQRLAIARVLLCDPKVLLLDEATSALDAQTEAGILETIATLKQGRTVISVTHRLSWAKEADQILVLEGGQIVEQGTHGELVAARGLYQCLYEEQIGKGELTHAG